jgi:hypothetical protein
MNLMFGSLDIIHYMAQVVDIHQNPLSEFALYL